MALTAELPPPNSPAARIGPQSAGARATNEPTAPDAKAKQTGITTERFNAIIREQARLPGGATLTPGVIDAITANATPQTEDEAKALVAEVNSALVSMNASGRSAKAVEAVQEQIKQQENTMQGMAGVASLVLGQLRGDPKLSQQGATMLGNSLANRPKDLEISPQMAALGDIVSTLGRAFHDKGITAQNLGSTTAALNNGVGTSAGQTPDAAALAAQQRKAAHGSIAV